MSDTDEAPPPPDEGPASSRKGVLGLVFLTVFLDLVGFSILFPLFPDLLEYYLGREGEDSAIGRLRSRLVSLIGEREGADFAVVTLFGGLLGTLYSVLQFLFAPLWGALSDRRGRRATLLVTLAGTALSYVAWFFAGTFALLVVSRVLGGIMAGNVSVASAVVADVSSRTERARNMAVIGVAVGLGFVIGPALGGLAYTSLDVLGWLGPSAASSGVNPFSGPALVAFVLASFNWLWAWRRFPETHPRGSRTEGEERRRHLPFRALREIAQPGVTLANAVYFTFAVAFAAMEFTLVFLAAERLDFGPLENAWMFVFIGLVIAFVQGGFVRRMAPRIGEKRLCRIGLVLLVPGFLLTGSAASVPVLYLGLFLLAAGSAMEMPSLSGLVSLYAPEDRQGLALGTFRSMGALSRAIGPLLGALLYWSIASWAPYYLGAAFLLVPLALSARLPEVRHGDAHPASS